MTTDITVPVEEFPEVTLVTEAALVAAVNDLDQRMAEAPLIVDQESFDVVRSIVANATKLKGKIDRARKDAATPFNKIVDKINAAAKPFIDSLQLIINDGKSQEGAFLVERDRQLAVIEHQRRIQEAIAAQDLSRPTAPLVLDSIEIQPIVAPLTTVYDVEITDIEQIPGEYFMLDMQKLRHDLLTKLLTVPGARRVELKRLDGR